MTRIFAFLLVVLSTGLAAAADPVEVDKHEILRYGNTVQYVDGETWNATDDAHAALAAREDGLPPDDFNKWHISVIRTKGCGPCIELFADWDKTEELQAWAMPRDAAHSFCHFHSYYWEDASQRWRWKKIEDKIKSFPTIIIQPPLGPKGADDKASNPPYGDPSTVVMLATYSDFDNDPKKLAQGIHDNITAYVKRLSEKNEINVQRFGQAAQPGRLDRDPPFTPPPINDTTVTNSGNDVPHDTVPPRDRLFPLRKPKTPVDESKPLVVVDAVARAHWSTWLLAVGAVVICYIGYRAARSAQK